MNHVRLPLLGTFVLLTVSLSLAPCQAQWPGKEELLAEVEKTFGDPPNMVRLDPEQRVWADRAKRRIVVDGYIALDDGQLEMLACLVATKEHESVVACFTTAQLVHAGLLAVGAQVGKPVQWEPNYAPPTGSEIRVFALWKDDQGKKQTIDAREWVREIGTKDTVLSTNFVFAGSKMWKDPDTGKERYLAEGGELICVSNFSTATLDVPIESSKVNAGLLFAANADKIPERFTPVRLVLQVVEPKKSADARNKTGGASGDAPATLPQAQSSMSEGLPKFDSIATPAKKPEAAEEQAPEKEDETVEPEAQEVPSGSSDGGQ